VTLTFGARNDHSAFHDYFEKFYRDVFFPYLEENNIDTVVQFGDLFDRRKYINFLTLYRSRQFFFDELKARNIKLDVFVGNHDTFYKNTNDVNSPELLLGEYDNITAYSKHGEVEYDGLKVALIPWVNSSNHNDIVKFINETKAQILFGHLELAGFEMHKGAINDHGQFDNSLLSKFDIVCSGHFHHKSSNGNIHYLGTPYEMSWSDYNDHRGFHIFDTDTRKLEFVRNPFVMYNKIHYDDSDKESTEVLGVDLYGYKDTFVKVVVRQKTNPFWFDVFIQNLEKAGVVDLQVVEDHFNLNLEDDSDIVSEAEDTLTFLRKVVDQIETTVPKKSLDNFLTQLYTEALYVE
jgi:DNA repair exonuclease SbcCD nuclease subunit